jgi:hypothetical protein
MPSFDFLIVEGEVEDAFKSKILCFQSFKLFLSTLELIATLLCLILCFYQVFSKHMALFS